MYNKKKMIYLIIDFLFTLTFIFLIQVLSTINLNTNHILPDKALVFDLILYNFYININWVLLIKNLF